MPRIAIAQLKPRKGAYAENLARLGELFRRLGTTTEPPALLVLPETSLTGYFVEGGVRELAKTAEEQFDDLARVHRESQAAPGGLRAGLYGLGAGRATQ